jgi:hypothetical protein
MGRTPFRELALENPSAIKGQIKRLRLERSRLDGELKALEEQLLVVDPRGARTPHPLMGSDPEATPRTKDSEAARGIRGKDPGSNRWSERVGQDYLLRIVFK